MNPENMVCERRQTKVTYYMVLLTCNVQNRHTHKDTNRIVVSRNSMKGEWGMTV